MLESYNFKLEKRGTPFLASSVPNVSLDDLAINIRTLPNSRLGLQIKLVLCEPREQVGFSHTRITDQNQFEQLVIIIFMFVHSHVSIFTFLLKHFQQFLLYFCIVWTINSNIYFLLIFLNTSFNRFSIISLSHLNIIYLFIF